MLLVSLLTPNPVHCLDCKAEIDPASIAINSHLSEAIANWRDIHDALYRLWLDSGQYEQWAKQQLLDPAGQINTRGLALRAKLHSIAPTHYWWFWDAEEPEPDLCPACSAPLGQ